MPKSEFSLSWSGIGLVGLPGSGKTVAASLLANQLGLKIVIMGDVIREEAQRRGIPENPTEMRQLMVTLREEEGEAVIAIKCLQKISEFSNTLNKIVIIDGLRSVPELEAFQRGFQSFYLISILASPQIRFQRLQKRDRSDDPSAWEIFEARDALEVKVGVADLLEWADFSIRNEHDLANLVNQIQELVVRIKKKVAHNIK